MRGPWPKRYGYHLSIIFLADAIAADGMVAESDPLKSGIPSIDFKYRRIDMSPAIAFQDPKSHENCMHCIRARALF